MNTAIENIEEELKSARNRSSTNTGYDYAYANGLEYALQQIKSLATPVVRDHIRVDPSKVIKTSPIMIREDFRNKKT
jgi:hypothetical protein